jgi:S1-C subfamily serine protease
VATLQLRYVTGPRRDQTLIFSGARVRIGRSRDNDVMLPEVESPQSSAHHAEARREHGVWWIVDLGSTNGTLLNGAPIERAQLHSGDHLSFGDLDVVVELGSPRRTMWLAASAAVAVIVAAAVLLALARQWRRSPFEGIAASASESVYLLAVERGGRRAATATAFAVDRDRALLATNAHVVEPLTRGLNDPTGAERPVAVVSDRDTALPLARIWIHPEWRKGSVAHDVALVELAGRPPIVPLTLGDARSVERLRRGTSLATFGFPAVSTDAMRPRGRLAVDVVGDVRLPYLEVGLMIAPGTSGSPVFDDTGVVVGIVVGGDFVGDSDGRGRRPSGSGVNWVIAVTALTELLERVR